MLGKLFNGLEAAVRLVIGIPVLLVFIFFAAIASMMNLGLRLVSPATADTFERNRREQQDMLVDWTFP